MTALIQRLWVMLLLLPAWPSAGAPAEAVLKCHICDQPITGGYFRIRNMRTGEETAACGECGKLTTRCFDCSLPVRTNGLGYKRLIDGRYLCPCDLPDVIADEAAAKRICETVADDLNRQFSRFLTLPSTNVLLTVVDYVHLQGLFKTPGYARTCSSVFGATLSLSDRDGRIAHSINVLSYLLPDRLAAVYAHELGHAWLNENMRENRPVKLSSDAIEGFCEFIAYKLAEARQCPVEQQLIKDNQYTHGQIDLFLEAGQRYGMNTIIEWVLHGDDDNLSATEPERIRSVTLPVTKARRRMPPSNPAPNVATPTKLLLQGISGSPQHRLAMVNDKTLRAGDIAAVRVSGTNLIIRCLEVTDHSVSLRDERTGEKTQLLLGEK